MAKRTVLFLGAGASKPLGFPITTEILPAIWSGLQNGAWRKWSGMLQPEDARDLEFLIRTLFPGITRKTSLWSGGSIVDVISLLDQLVLEGRTPHPNMSEVDLRRVRIFLNMGINGVLRGQKSPALRSGLVSWIIGQATQSGPARFTLISTNYDTAIDLRLFRELERSGMGRGAVESTVDMGCSWRSAFDGRVRVRPKDARLAVLKLHGSLNWLRCETCGYVVMNVRERIVSLDFWRLRNEYNECWCGGRLRSVLITPSLVRDVRDTSLLSIWHAALEDLRRADEWVMVGYSLPSEDVAIRSMLLRAFHSRAIPSKPRIRVVQKWDRGGTSADAERNRYRLFFSGRHLRSRDIHDDGVAPFVQRLRPLDAQVLRQRVRARLA